MDIDKLETFLIVAKDGSFRAAAQKRFLSPRAVSKQMNHIEAELGVKLFEREKNRTKLTSYGNDFIVTAQDIVNSYKTAVTKIKTRNAVQEEYLKSGISSPSQATIWQTALTDFLSKNPNINVEIQQENGRRLLNLVNEMALDFCISPYYGTHEMGKIFPNLKRIDLYTGTFYIGISKLNPLSQQKSISFTQLQNLKLLYYTPFISIHLKEIFLEKFSGLLREEQVEQINTLEQRNLMVAINKGFGLFPSILVDEEELQNPLINFLPISDDCNDFYSSAIWYNQQNNNPVLKKLVDEFSNR
ncbi:LysR family transcriptional regulator [Limosilactobacillus reuteri]|uniref:LysR family transcriptional regulator n=1 Tax=Limosilactobacillus reuteri TaxID=1598 RepID=UPI000A1DDE8D|nr:LysR family transcriptional regulator [Limosilactobacillus reuteri]PEG88364.1 LysR family transcriptional regulator [Lactobacillus sp. UMNPBX13]PEH00114.1 LysR family transcriptional regulator [Lactobacillus sp. UMNPBX7]MBM6811661.1 LysR family transcriptional regulator [Limosilactobacillus reuteri]MQB95955.1 LysR family transcriptional regulator [Limosilactobacillus reuteri]HJE41215.1 LysR family transcriptional regulator [Limosilactobacillus reuteri]